MKRTIQTLTATMTAILAFVAIGTSAQASNAGEYKAAMREFAPVIVSWAAEADAALAAAALKPELACAESMQELAMRGESIRADLAGMAVEAPKAVRHPHLAATASLAVMVTEAEGACGREAEAQKSAAEAFKAFGAPMKVLQLYSR